MSGKITAEWANKCHIRLSRSLGLMSEAVQKEAAEALKRTAKEIAEEAKANVRVKTGALRNSIKKSVRRRRESVIARVFADYPKNGKTRKASTRKQSAGSRDYYAFAVEYGTKRSKAYPFLKPAANRLQDRAVRRIEAIVNKELAKV